MNLIMSAQESCTNVYSVIDIKGMWNVSSFLCVCVFFPVEVLSHHHIIPLVNFCEKRRPAHFQQSLKRTKLLRGSESTERMSHNTRRILRQKGATAANKTFKTNFGGKWTPERGD